MAKRVIVARKEQDLGQRPGLDLGIKFVDQLVQGVRRTDVVGNLAFAGVGKTTGLIRQSWALYLQDVVPMFISLEMEESELTDKFDAMASNISSSALRARQLNQTDWEAYERAAERARERAIKSKADMIIVDDTEGEATVDRIAAFVQRWQPGAVFVDYVSLLSAHRDIRSDWERVTYITRSLKRLARSMRVPVFVAAQSSREAEKSGPTLDNIAYSLSLAQDANILIGYHQTEEMDAIRKVEVRLLKNRASRKGNSFEFWDRDRMIFEPWTSSHEWRIRDMTTEAPPPPTSNGVVPSALLRPSPPS
jgi:replicative DNA helicase